MFNQAGCLQLLEILLFTELLLSVMST